MTREQRLEIARLCPMISDDSFLACYVGQGVTKEDVRRVRSTLPQRDSINGTRYYRTSHKANSSDKGSGLESHITARREAEQGSAALLKAIARYHVNQGRFWWGKAA